MPDFLKCIKPAPTASLEQGKIYLFSHRYASNIGVRISATRIISAPETYFTILPNATFDIKDYFLTDQFRPYQVLTMDNEPLGVRYQTSNNQFFDMEIDVIQHSLTNIPTAELQDFNGVYKTEEEYRNNLFIIDLSDSPSAKRYINR